MTRFCPTNSCGDLSHGDFSSWDLSRYSPEALKNARINEQQKTQSRDLIQRLKSRIVTIWHCVFKSRLCTCSEQKPLESSMTSDTMPPLAASRQPDVARLSCSSHNYMGPCRMRQFSTSASRCCLPREPCPPRMSQPNPPVLLKCTWIGTYYETFVADGPAFGYIGHAELCLLSGGMSSKHDFSLVGHPERQGL
jgi:hypothetical protein